MIIHFFKGQIDLPWYRPLDQKRRQQDTRNFSSWDGKTEPDLRRSSFSLASFSSQHLQILQKYWDERMSGKLQQCFCLVTVYHLPILPCKLVYLMQSQPLLQIYEPVVIH